MPWRLHLKFAERDRQKIEAIVSGSRVNRLVVGPGSWRLRLAVTSLSRDLSARNIHRHGGRGTTKVRNRTSTCYAIRAEYRDMGRTDKEQTYRRWRAYILRYIDRAIS